MPVDHCGTWPATRELEAWRESYTAICLTARRILDDVDCHSGRATLPNARLWISSQTPYSRRVPFWVGSALLCGAFRLGRLMKPQLSGSSVHTGTPRGAQPRIRALMRSIIRSLQFPTNPPRARRQSIAH